MARIAYFYREMSEYIEIDLRALAERHEVTVTGCPSRWPDPVRTWRTVAGSDVVMSWFASWHALLPGLFARLQGKPFVLTVGGYDTACLPGIDYGHGRDGFKSWIAKRVMALATTLVAISDFTIRELDALGFRGARVVRIPLGLDPARYACDVPRDAGLAITTGGVSANNLARKGLEPFVRAAALLPHRRFVVVGAWMDEGADRLRALATPNVTFTNRVPHEEKVRWMSRSEVVVQASQHEAFGLSLAEAMLCGAVPVVTDAGALPWVAGGTGEVVPGQDPLELAAAIERAFAKAGTAGPRARERVLREFTVGSRAAAIERVLAGSAAGVESVLHPGADAAAADAATEHPTRRAA
ncbi:MAG: glycosyltransferase family 4 protein [Candidatus Eisenbacteria bacterium]